MKWHNALSKAMSHTFSLDGVEKTTKPTVKFSRLMCVKVFFYSHHHLTHKKTHHHIDAHFHHKEQSQTVSDRFTRSTHGETINRQRAEKKSLNFQNKMDLHRNGFSSTEWLSIVNLIAIKCFQPGINIVCCTIFCSIAFFLCRPQCISPLARCILLVRTVKKVEKKMESFLLHRLCDVTKYTQNRRRRQ